MFLSCTLSSGWNQSYPGTVIALAQQQDRVAVLSHCEAEFGGHLRRGKVEKEKEREEGEEKEKEEEEEEKEEEELGGGRIKRRKETVSFYFQAVQCLHNV